MQYTLRRIPRTVDAALRRRASAEHRSMNDVALEALRRGLGVDEAATVRRKLGDIAGTWADDPEFDAAIAAQHRIDRKLWK